MNLFGWKAGRAAARPVLARAAFGSGRVSGRISGIELGLIGSRPVSPPDFRRGYEAQLREDYLGNAVAQRAVRLVADAVAGAPVRIEIAENSDRPTPDRKREGGTRAGLLALVQSTSGGQGLLETVAVHLLLHGNAYVQVMGDQAGAISELYALRPDRVTVEPDAQGWPAAYVYRVGESVARLEAAASAGAGATGNAAGSVIHIRSHHPLDDHYGLGCLGAAAGAIAIHNAAARWNKALLDNAARPSGALVFDAGDGAALSADQFERLKAEMTAGFAGAGNAGRPMLLEGGLKWQAMSLSPADMDFIEAKAAAAREIALAFGVPPMLMGLPGDATYANYREASKALWRQTVLPLTGKVLTGISQGLTPWFPDVRLAVDLDRVPALSEDRERLWHQVSAADFLSDDEKRAMLGVGAL